MDGKYGKSGKHKKMGHLGHLGPLGRGNGNSPDSRLALGVCEEGDKAALEVDGNAVCANCNNIRNLGFIYAQNTFDHFCVT